ncbi:hypothetical protein BVY13_03825 [Bacillus amyloliquefaciens]|nr:hypothetical protein BVY13_03825 [Bacillus amyloliquefaciens]
MQGLSEAVFGLEVFDCCVDEEFKIPGSSETCMYQRDTKLSAAERVSCHCVLSPVVNNEI